MNPDTTRKLLESIAAKAPTEWHHEMGCVGHKCAYCGASDPSLRTMQRPESHSRGCRWANLKRELEEDRAFELALEHLRSAEGAQAATDELRKLPAYQEFKRRFDALFDSLEAKSAQTTEAEMARLHSELEHAHKRIAELEGWIRNATGGAEAKQGLLMHKIENPDSEP